MNESLAASIAPRLEMLRLLATEGNVTRVAAQMDVPQPTVSRWLAALSTEVGAPVVVRDGRGVQLTRAGHLLAAAAASAMTALETGTRQVLEEIDPDRGRVVLGFLHMLGRSLVPELLRAYRFTHPQVRFGLRQSSRAEIIAWMESGEVDLALYSPPPTAPDLAWVPVQEQELKLVLPDTHKLANRTEVEVAEVANEDIVGLEHGFGMRQITDDLCEAAGFSPRMAFEGQESDTVRGLVLSGLGVAVLPEAELLTPGLVEISLRPRVHRTLALVWPAHDQLSPAVRSFRDFSLSQRTDR
ncbi:LysR family transcriptional regulator [Kibdelosporangium phytohabitans]|uniref:LysR family transcriptional regulator n=2 Tax=Kibdelosporangium phytohabitans TaxID=860235 RepID=A0A0N9HWX5_9PSEU|nr:LysR family transcriptional regulator [Kibdelosporangium phytohabitans]ALG06670.1 LysR family transcriptional regulator [Kibdelosporangium phytohabitans]